MHTTNLTINNKYYFLKPEIATYPCYSNTCKGILLNVFPWGLLIQDFTGEEYTVDKYSIFDINPIQAYRKNPSLNDIP